MFEAHKGLERGLRLLLCIIGVGFSICGFSQKFQLSEAHISYESPLFSDSLIVDIELDLDGTSIYYTLDKSEPNQSSSVYEGPLVIKSDCVLKVKAFHDNFIPSDTKSVEFTEIGNTNKIVELAIESFVPNQYKAQGGFTLIDGSRGSTNHRDGQWIATQGADLTIVFETKDRITEAELLIGILKSSGSWILGPSEIICYALNAQNNEYEYANSTKSEAITENESPKLEFIRIPIDLKNHCSKFKIELKKIEQIPDWHQADSTNAWIFIDEIIVK